MTPRERFLRVFRGERVAPPLLEDGLREGVLERWQEQGMPSELSPVTRFDLTLHDRIGPDITPRVGDRGDLLSLSERGYRAAFRPSRDRFPNHLRYGGRRTPVSRYSLLRFDGDPRWPQDSGVQRTLRRP